jgi:putative acetyltransferase
MPYMEPMEIVDFHPDLAPAFRTLNEAWITRFFVLEDKDAAVLNDPQGKIIDAGGHVFFVVDAGDALGCCALMAMPDGGFEVAKMAVVDGHKGKGFGRALMQACVDRAQALGARRLYLETNSSLAPALSLYRSFGFRDVPPRPTDYARADVFMELRL